MRTSPAAPARAACRHCGERRPARGLAMHEHSCPHNPARRVYGAAAHPATDAPRNPAPPSLDAPSLEAIRQQPDGQLLTAAEEQLLGRLLQDPAAAAEAREILCRRNTRLIWKIALAYRGHGIPDDDLYQYGWEGFLYGLTKWDPDRGLRLSTYLHTWVRQKVQRATIDEAARGVRLPVHMEERRRLVWRYVSGVEAASGRTPSDAEICAALRLDAGQLREMRAAERLTLTDSLDASIRDDADEDRSLYALMVDPSADVEGQALGAADRERIARWLGRLADRERHIIHARHGFGADGPQTLEQVAVGLGLTRERVRQIEHIALKKLRHFAAEDAARAPHAPGDA